MGRIYDALRRSETEARQSPEPPARARDVPAWLFDRQEAESHAQPRDSANQAAGEAPGRDAIPRTERQPASVAPPVRPVGPEGEASERLVTFSGASPLLVEQFRNLAATLQQVDREKPLKSLIVTSASPRDGKTHVAANLALTLSESFRRRVLLIDADLRRPSLHRLLGVANWRGLSEALKSRTAEQPAVVPVSETLTLLPAGRPEPDPLGGLSSDCMKGIVEDAIARFDWVIVDAPPVGLLADGRPVCEMVDAAILVIRAGVTKFPDVEAAVETLGGEERILGIVLNAVELPEIRGKDYYGYYSGRRSRTH